MNVKLIDTSEATVPTSVIIPANTTSINFNVTAVDDGFTDGTQTVTISAAAVGLTGAQTSLQVSDNEALPTADLFAVLKFDEGAGTAAADTARSAYAEEEIRATA